MYYVYLHKKPNGEVFYVGKGTKLRAWSKHGRNEHWNNIVKKYGEFAVEIVKDYFTTVRQFPVGSWWDISLDFFQLA